MYTSSLDKFYTIITGCEEIYGTCCILKRNDNDHFYQ